MSRYSLHFPIRVPDDVLVELSEFTGKFWSDSLGQEPFVIEAPDRPSHDVAGGERISTTQRSTARQTGPRPSESRPSNHPAAPQDNGTQHRSGSGRSARRRKRRAAKQTPGNP